MNVLTKEIDTPDREGAREVHPDNVIPLRKRNVADRKPLTVGTFRRVACIADERGHCSPADIGEEAAEAILVAWIDSVGVGLANWETGARLTAAASTRSLVWLKKATRQPPR
ncbi:hypothetical protein [Mesorhizobium sp. M0500]|uniref:hypothetical protein n=1 Tax=Mesorhizobium sp. M0500 TaxID=2956953 RepID=UPI0033353CC6